VSEVVTKVVLKAFYSLLPLLLGYIGLLNLCSALTLRCLEEADGEWAIDLATNMAIWINLVTLTLIITSLLLICFRVRAYCKDRQRRDDEMDGVY